MIMKCLSCICLLPFTMTQLSRFERCMTTLLLSYFFVTIVREVVIITQPDHFYIVKSAKIHPKWHHRVWHSLFYCHNQCLSSLLHRDRLPASPNRCRKQTLAKRCGAHLSGHGLPLNHLPSCPLLIFNWVFWIDEGPKMFESFSSFWKRRQ